MELLTGLVSKANAAFVIGSNLFRQKAPPTKQLEISKLADQILQVLSVTFKIAGASKPADLSANGRRGLKFKLAYESVISGKAKVSTPSLSMTGIRTFAGGTLDWLTTMNVPVLTAISVCRAVNSIYPLGEIASSTSTILSTSAEAVAHVSEKWLDGVFGFALYSVCKTASWETTLETLGSLWTYRDKVGYLPLILQGVDTFSTSLEVARIPIKFTGYGVFADPFLALVAAIIRISLILLYSRIDSPEARLKNLVFKNV